MGLLPGSFCLLFLQSHSDREVQEYMQVKLYQCFSYVMAAKQVMNHSITTGLFLRFESVYHKATFKKRTVTFILEAQCNKSIKGEAKCYSKQIAEQNTKTLGVLVLDPNGENNTSSEVTNSSAACVADTEIHKVKFKTLLHA